MKTFKSAYTSDAPFKEFLRLLKNADEAEFKKALKRENLSEEFIHTAFFCAEKISDDTRVALAQHFNAPASVLLMCLRFYPEWVEESPATLGALEALCETRI